MTEDSRVAIIIVNWNGKDITIECLSSLSNITYRNRMIVVVDNASSDDSVEAITQTFPDVVVLPMESNLGFARGCNTGMRYALDHGAELLLLLNNDTTVHPEFLTHLVGRLLSDPMIGMVAPKIYYHDDPERIWFAGGTVSFWTGTMRHTGIRELDRGQHDIPRDIAYASGCCILTRRFVVESVGMLDESYAMYTEDADWSIRVRKAGLGIVYEPKAHIWHKLSVSTGGHLSWYKMKNKYLSNMRFFGKYAAWYQWFVFPWMSVVMNTVATVRYLMQTRTR